MAEKHPAGSESDKRRSMMAWAIGAAAIGGVLGFFSSAFGFLSKKH